MPAWAVRPSAASARTVTVHAVFLPRWSRARAARCPRSALMFFRLHTEFKQPGQRPRSMSEYLLPVSAEPQSSHLAASENPNTGAWPNWQIQMQEISTRHCRLTSRWGFSLARLAVSRSGHLFAQCGSPNISVKGTSCGKPQAAPYVGR